MMAQKGNLTTEGISQNTSTLDGWIPMCEEDFQRIDSVAYTLAAVNTLSILYNMFHIYVLSTLSSLKRSAYYHILTHLTAADIHMASYTICQLIFNRTHFFSISTLHAIVIYDILFSTSYTNRYLIMTVACLERYYALCRPMEHKTSKLVNYIHIWLPACWIFSFLLIAVRDVVFVHDLCFDSLTGPAIRNGLGPGVFTSTASIVPSIITGLLVTRVLVELFCMRKREVAQTETQVKRATLYLSIIVIVFFVCLIPPSMSYLMLISGVENLSSMGYYIGVVFFTTLYGFLNTLIYGWMNSTYRKRVRLILHCKRNQIEVIGPSGVTSTSST